MKKMLQIATFWLLLPVMLGAQNHIPYKAIIHNETGDPLANASLRIQFTILENGTNAVYRETHDTNTDENGIIILSIGEGTVHSGDYGTIAWGSAVHYLKTEIDKGNGYVDMGTIAMETVPYAHHARTADSIAGRNPDPGLSEILAAGNQANAQIKNLSDPTDIQDAVTKAYVDELKASLELLKYSVGMLVRDIDGNVYQAVTLGTQTWFAENLRTTKYNDGMDIPLVSDPGIWVNLTTPAYCWYNNDETVYGDTYGPLYNWYAVETGKLCPAGWHVPSRAELLTLIQYLVVNGYNYDGTTDFDDSRPYINRLAKALASTSNWEYIDWEGVPGNTDYPEYRNKTGFSAQPGGGIWNVFANVTQRGHWWLSDTNSSGNVAYMYTLCYRFVHLEAGRDEDVGNKEWGFAVRCMKD